METIKELHRCHGGILGYRRMTIFINRQLDTNYNKKRIRRLMKILGISSVIRRLGSLVRKLVLNVTKTIVSTVTLQLQHLIKNGVQMSLIFYTG